MFIKDVPVVLYVQNAALPSLWVLSILPRLYWNMNFVGYDEILLLSITPELDENNSTGGVFACIPKISVSVLVWSGVLAFC
jgi:hypothetical protein